VADPFKGNIERLYTLQTTTPDGRDLVFFTGTIVIEDAFPHWLPAGEGGPEVIIPDSDTDGWRRGTVEVVVGPPWEQLEIENVAPVAAPASFFSVLSSPPGVQPGFGWATDRCYCRTVNRMLFLDIDVAVANNTRYGQLLRIAFQVTAIGVLAS
jgi:hypothetical protein